MFYVFALQSLVGSQSHRRGLEKRQISKCFLFWKDKSRLKAIAFGFFHILYKFVSSVDLLFFSSKDCGGSWPKTVVLPQVERMLEDEITRGLMMIFRSWL